jgi:hypothetical protein
MIDLGYHAAMGHHVRLFFFSWESGIISTAGDVQGRGNPQPATDPPSEFGRLGTEYGTRCHI